MRTTPLNLRDGQPRLLVCAIAIVAAFAAKGLSLIPGYAFDDYAGAYTDQSLRFYLSQGRYTQAALQWILTHARMTTTDIAWVTTFVCLLALAGIAAHIAARIKKPQTSFALVATWVGIICAYPYFTEYFSFRQALYNASFYLIFTLVHLVVLSRVNFSRPLLAHENRAHVAQSIFWLLLAMGGHQITVAIAAGAIYAITLASDEFPALDFRAKIKRLIRALGPAVVSLVAYVVLYKIVKMLFPASVDSRGELLSPSEFHTRLHDLLQLCRKVFWQAEPTVPRMAKLMLAIGAVPLLVRVAIKQPVMTVLWFVGLIGLTALALLPLAASGVWWPVPRALSALGFIFGAMAAALTVIARAEKPIYALPWLAAVLLLSFSSASVLQQQQRLNRWDMTKAQQIVHDLQLRFGGTPSKPVVISGGSFAYPERLSTMDGDLNASAFIVPWALTGLFGEASGNAITFENDPTHAAVRCKDRPRWPDGESIFEADNKIFICL